MNKKLKVLHCPTSVGGNSFGLAQAERRLGLDSRVLVRTKDTFDYPCNINLHFENCPEFRKILKSFKAFFRYRSCFDVFHFNFGSTLVDYEGYRIPLWDLPYYPEKARLFATYNGCDARQKYPTVLRTEFSACHLDDCYSGTCSSGERDVIRNRRIRTMAKYVKKIFALNPDLCWFLPEDKTVFLPYTVAGWNEIQQKPVSEKTSFTIAHAPSVRSVKGTEHVLKAFEILKNRYSHVKTMIVENMPNAEALKKYAEADLFVDQLLTGWYGALSVEVMKMGIPVVCFIRKEDLKFLDVKMSADVQQAFINVTPETIADVLSSYVENRQLLREKREAGLHFVHQWHEPEKVAQITKQAYEIV